MHAIATALSAFSARATRGRRAVLVGYSGLLVLLLLGLAKLIAVRAAEDGVAVDPLALADMFSMMLVAGAMFVVAPAMVASQVAEERRSGTLDLLRTAPVSPTALTVGFLVGAPGSLYLLCAGPLALHVVAGLCGAIPFSAMVYSLLLVPLGAAAAMLIAMLLAISVAREGGGAAPLLVAGLLSVGMFITVALAGGPESMPWAFVHPAGALAALYQSFDGPFRATFSSPWRIARMVEWPAADMLSLEPLLAITVYLAATVLLLSAARRVVAGEVTSRLTKPTALALFALSAFALLLPLRVTTLPSELELSHLAGVAFALLMPYFACVLGATSSVIGTRARRMSPDGAPHAVALLMIAIAVAFAAFLFGGTRVVEVVFHRSREGRPAIGMLLLACTLPIYARWAATRLHSGAGRLAFWALVTVHLGLQVPGMVVVAEPSSSGHDVPYLLAQLDVVFGVILPLALFARQRVADRKAAAAAV